MENLDSYWLEHDILHVCHNYTFKMSTRTFQAMFYIYGQFYVYQQIQ